MCCVVPSPRRRTAPEGAKPAEVKKRWRCSSESPIHARNCPRVRSAIAESMREPCPQRRKSSSTTSSYTCVAPSRSVSGSQPAAASSGPARAKPTIRAPWRATSVVPPAGLGRARVRPHRRARDSSLTPWAASVSSPISARHEANCRPAMAASSPRWAGLTERSALAGALTGPSPDPARWSVPCARAHFSRPGARRA